MDAELDPAVRVARRAGGQHGIVDLIDLREAGVARGASARWIARGRLHRVHRGVYAVGHAALSREARWMAAVLACGREAVLSHRAAGTLWRLVAPTGGRIDVTVGSRSGRRAPDGVRLHRVGSLPADETAVRDGIPVTDSSTTAGR